MKVEPEPRIFLVESARKDKSKMQGSGMLKLLKFLIQIRFIPVDINKISFNMFSFNALLYILLYILTSHIILVVRIIFLPEIGTQACITIENQFLLAFYLFVPFIPLIISKILPQVPTITLAHDLKYPKMLTRFCISTSLIMLSGIFTDGIYSYYCYYYKDAVVLMIFEFIINILGHSLATLCWMIPLFLVSVWVEKFINYCSDTDIDNPANHAKECLKHFSAFHDGFRMYYYVVYRLSQFFMILALTLFYKYFVVSELAHNFEWEKTIYPTGTIFFSIALILNVCGLTSIFGDLNTAIKELIIPLKEELVYEKRRSERQKIRNILNDIDNIQPITEEKIDSNIIAMMSLVISFVIYFVKLHDKNLNEVECQYHNLTKQLDRN